MVIFARKRLFFGLCHHPLLVLPKRPPASKFRGRFYCNNQKSSISTKISRPPQNGLLPGRPSAAASVAAQPPLSGEKVGASRTAPDSPPVRLKDRCRRLPDSVFQYLGLDHDQIPGVRKNSLDEDFHRRFGNLDQLEHGIIGLPDDFLLFVERRRKDGVVDDIASIIC